MNIGSEVLTGNLLHQDLCQGKAVIAVDTVGPWIGLEALLRQGGQQTVYRRSVVPVPKEKGAGQCGSHQPRGVVEQHPYRDVPVPLVSHLKIGQIVGYRFIQFYLSRLCKLEHCHSRIELAYRSDPVENVC